MSTLVEAIPVITDSRAKLSPTEFVLTGTETELRTLLAHREQKLVGAEDLAWKRGELKKCQGKLAIEEEVLKVLKKELEV